MGRTLQLSLAEAVFKIIYVLLAYCAESYPRLNEPRDRTEPVCLVYILCVPHQDLLVSRSR